MTTLGLDRLPGRCSRCGFHIQTQGHGAVCTEALKADGIAAANEAAPEDVKARIDAAIRRLAATGEPFSANDLRWLGVTGGVVGGRFNAAAKAGLIRSTGERVPSNLASTHAHEIKVWIGGAR